MASYKYIHPALPTNGDGSPGSPFNNIQAGLTSLGRTPDQFLLLNTDYAYDLTTIVTGGGTGLRGLNVSNVTIGTYGGGSTEPMIDGLTYLPAFTTVWTNEGPADGGGWVWSIQLGTSQAVARVFAASQKNGLLVKERILGEALRRCPDGNFSDATITVTATLSTMPSIKAHLNKDDVWFGANPLTSGADAALGYKLFMWTPSNLQDPSMYYQNLAVAQHGNGTYGFNSAFNFFNAVNCKVQNIEVRGATGFPLQVAVDDNLVITTEGISFYQCKTTASAGGLKFASTTKSLAYPIGARRLEARECVFDTSTSAKEQEPNVAYGRLAGQNQTEIRNRVSDAVIVDCVGINAFHAAACMGALDSLGARPIRSGYLRNKFRASSWSTYARPLDVSLCEDSCFAERNEFTAFNVVTQLAGSLRVIGNAWRGLRKAIRKPGNEAQSTDGWVMFAGYRGDGGSSMAFMGNDRYFDMRPDGLIFAHNSCDGAYGPMFEFSIFAPGDVGVGIPAANFKDYSVRLWNNLGMDVYPERAGKPSVTTFESPGYSVGVQSIENNLFYKGPGLEPTAKWGATTYSNINSAPGHAGNITLDPKVDAELRPLPGSPLIGAAKVTGSFIDLKGKRFKPSPSIGAIEDNTMLPRQLRNF